tara:strand:+ start:349 stop:948 length:600 start_codon:yes stop_codon:yes gene_type:complete
MALSRDKYVPNTDTNIVKLVTAITDNMDHDALYQTAIQGLTDHYIDNDQCFVEDYYETFPDEDPEQNGVQEEEDKIIYYHGHHSNPCVVGTICIPTKSGYELIIITHNMIYEDYCDSLSDITKVWDAHVQVEIAHVNRYGTDYDSCIHIPLDIGEHTALTNQVLKQILLDNKVEFVTISSADAQTTLDEFFAGRLGLKG